MDKLSELQDQRDGRDFAESSKLRRMSAAEYFAYRLRRAQRRQRILEQQADTDTARKARKRLRRRWIATTIKSLPTDTPQPYHGADIGVPQTARDWKRSYGLARLAIRRTLEQRNQWLSYATITEIAAQAVAIAIERVSSGEKRQRYATAGVQWRHVVWSSSRSALRQYRKSQRIPTVAPDFDQQQTELPTDEALHTVASVILAALDKQSANLLWLSAQGWSYRELARLLGQPESRTYQQLRTALAAAREAISMIKSISCE